MCYNHALFLKRHYSVTNLKSLPVDITSYDLFKTFAVLFMIVDHMGYYFFPDDMWWRAVGRSCVPIWFFLIGYAQSRDIGWKLWIGGAILLLANLPTGLFIFPLNILFTMAFIRLLIDKLMVHGVKGKHEFWALNVMFFFLIIPSNMFTEYGTQGLIMAILGYVMRHRTEFIKIDPQFIGRYFAFCFISFVLVQGFLFSFNQEQSILLSAEILAVMGALYFFEPKCYPRLSKALPNVIVTLLQFCGRRTLEIYVAHLLLFKFMAAYNGRFEWFEWTIRATS